MIACCCYIYNFPHGIHFMSFLLFGLVDLKISNFTTIDNGVINSFSTRKSAMNLSLNAANA